MWLSVTVGLGGTMTPIRGTSEDSAPVVSVWLVIYSNDSSSASVC